MPPKPDKGSKAVRSRTEKQFRIGKPAAIRKKTGTVTTKKHRFESFTQRISKINIDPIRRSQARAHVHQQDEASHFQIAFAEWKELNLSESFTSFARQVAPISNSLPQILLFQDRIADLLVEYINKQESVSLEPLLSLLAHFAHDLGARFEKHFQRTVSAVSQLAAKHADVAVIEWSFTCLAWLFKYLQRLLVPDLRPVYDLMAPLLGRTHQRGFVMKFAAEAMSFLVRKAASAYRKNKAPLESIVEHAFQDLASVSIEQVAQYQEGLITLFSEAIKGVQRGVYTYAGHIVASLLKHLEVRIVQPGENDFMLVTVRYILTEVVHNSDAEGFRPIVESVLDSLPTDLIHPRLLESCSGIIFVITGTRKGTRIDRWDGLMTRVGTYLDAVQKEARLREYSAMIELLKAVSSLLQYSPHDKVVTFNETAVMPKLNSAHWDKHFLGFCIYVVDMGVERFEQLLLPWLKKWVPSRWDKYEEQLCLLLPRFAAISYTTITELRLPEKGQNTILATVRKLGDRDAANDVLALCNRYIDVLESLTCPPLFLQELSEVLWELQCSLATAKDAGHDSPRVAFLLSKALRFSTKHLSKEEIQVASLHPFFSISRYHGTRLDYLRSLLNLIERASFLPHAHKAISEGLMLSIIPNLASPSHDLRQATLELMLATYKQSSPNEVESIQVALNVERSQFGADAARSIAMNVRKLAALYVDGVAKDEHLSEALPAYCFGLLNVRLTSAWDDAANALETMSKAAGKEDVIIKRALEWLQPFEEPPMHLTDDEQAELPAVQVTKPYQCSNILKLEQFAGRDLTPSSTSEISLQSALTRDTALVPSRSLSDRSQALRVLAKVSHIAERKSRILVPVLLQWALGETNDDESADEDGETSESLQPAIRWNRKDQKALLHLFSLFVNPTVLYRSDEVYQALLGLLQNGDVEIQRSALKAIFAWKLPSVRAYEENLMNILDENRFRDEVTVFLNNTEEDSKIRGEHRQVLMPVLLSMLYGRIVTRAGSGGNRGTQQSKRRAVLLTLARFGQTELSDFVHIALSSLDNLELVSERGVSDELLDHDLVPIRKQLGTLNMLDDMLEQLGDVVAPFADRLICAILYCTIRASRQIQQIETGVDIENASLLRAVRQSGYTCLVSLFTACPKVNWSSYASAIVINLINPRLEKLPIETAQGTSAILKLVAVWAGNAKMADILVEPNVTLLENVADCLIVPSAKDEVKTYIFNNIMKTVVEQARKLSESGQASHLLDSLKSGLGGNLMERVASSLKAGTDKTLLDAGIRVMTGLAGYVTEAANLGNFITTCLHLLGLPTRLINPRLKGEVLALLDHFVPLYDFSKDQATYKDAVHIVSSLFSFFQDTQNRHRLATVFQKLCAGDDKLEDAAKLCEDLNAFSSVKLDEPDFEKRLRAFTIINDEKFCDFEAPQWQPIIHNMLYHIKDNQELSIRTSASLSLRKFIQRTCTSDSTATKEQKALLTDAVLPAIQTGMKEDSELIRAEYVAVLAEVVRSDWPATKDMQVLLGMDEESAFFNNILHIQQHRRTRALRRLTEFATSMSSTNVARFCIPLIENFYLGGDGQDHNLASEAINTLDGLAEALEWQRYRALLQRMVGEAAKFDSKIKIRAMGGVVNALFRASKSKKSAEASTMEVDGDGTIDKSSLSQLARTLPDYAGLRTSLAKSVLGKLTEQVHFKDESTVDLRILVATSAVKVVMCHSPDDIDLLLPPLLLDICNILKSRSQEARDAARKTLAEVTAIIGSRYFGYLVRQLRSALRSGPQKHVLSYTVHAILVTVTPTLAAGELDYCLPDIMDIIVEDIFGMVAQEKESEGYLSKMKEVKKKSLSYDSMEILASVTKLQHVTELLHPVQDQLTRPRPKLEKIDELLRRLREGLRRNETAKSQDFLTLCYELLSDVHKKHAMSQASSAEPATYKFASFALELLRRVLDKYEDLKTASNLSGFLPLLRASMAQGVEEVEIASMRLFTSIIKIPFPEIDTDAKLYVRLAKRLIESASTTSAPVSQAALRLVSAVLRERPNADIPKYDWEENIAFILNRIKPDLQEPAKQGDRDLQVAAFNFLRSIINRSEPVAEMYSVMDVVREVMITSSEPPIPDLARSVYTRFLLDYFPEELKGFSKQLDFLVSNLRYPSHRGRISVMEVILFVINRKSDAAVQPMLVNFFLPLIVTLATDENEQCRDSAALVIHKIFEHADKEHTKTFRAQMLKWLDPEADSLWQCAGFQCWALYLDVHTTATKEAKAVLDSAEKIIVSGTAEEHESGILLQRALELVVKLCTLDTLSSVSFSAGASEMWLSIPTHLAHPLLAVRSATTHLISLYLTSFARAASARDETLSLPVTGPSGSVLTFETAIAIIEPSMQLLQVEVEDTIITKTIQNIGFLGRIAATSSGSNGAIGDNAEDDEEETEEQDDDLTLSSSADLLYHLLVRAASVLRTELTPSRTKLSAMNLLTSLIKSASASQLRGNTLYSILLPLHNLTDASIPQHSSSTFHKSSSRRNAPAEQISPEETTAEQLVTAAHELLTYLQTVLGGTEYVKARQVVQKRVQARREERRAKRAIDKVAAPERYEAVKRKKRIGGKERRRETNTEMAGRRRGY